MYTIDILSDKKTTRVLQHIGFEIALTRSKYTELKWTYIPYNYQVIDDGFLREIP